MEQEQIRSDREGQLTAELAIANNNNVMAHAYCGQYAKAIPFLLKSREIREKLTGFKCFNLYSPLVHLGVVYNYLGRNDEAVEVLTQALEDRQKELGLNDRVSLRHVEEPAPMRINADRLAELRRFSTPWVTSVTTSASLIPVYLYIERPSLDHERLLDLPIDVHSAVCFRWRESSPNKKIILHLGKRVVHSCSHSMSNSLTN